jgi:hypothetical protein
MVEWIDDKWDRTFVALSIEVELACSSQRLARVNALIARARPCALAIVTPVENCEEVYLLQHALPGDTSSSHGASQLSGAISTSAARFYLILC